MFLKTHAYPLTIVSNVLVTCLVLTSMSGCASVGEVREASGVAIEGNDLLIVGDGAAGTLFRCRE